MENNDVGSLEKLYINRRIEDFRQSDLSPLENKIDLLTRALVETKAFQITQAILLQAFLQKIKLSKSLDSLIFELNGAISYLRGRLFEGAIPENAFREWYSDVRKRLSTILTSSDLDVLLPSPSPWEKFLLPKTD